MSDVDIVIDIATSGVKEVYNLSNALQQLNRVVSGSMTPMRNLSARSKALSMAVGSADGELRKHAKTVSELSRNQAILGNEISRVRAEIKGLGKEYKFATGASAEFKNLAVRDLKAYEGALKSIKLRALTEDLKTISREQKRLGKDAQFVGRSLIIGLTTPITMFSRFALQSLVAVDQEFVRLTKVLESVAPTLDAAAQKMGVDLPRATAAQRAQLDKMVASYQELEKALTNTSVKFGLSKSLAVGLAGDFAELGIQSTKAISEITALTAATEKLGNMDIGAAKDLVQSLYFQALRAMQQSGRSRTMSAFEREEAAIKAATAQLNIFNAVENTTALSLRDLGDAFPEVAAAASSFGLSMTEAAGLLAPMKAAGFEVGASANSIKVSLQRVTAPTKQNQKLFEDLTKTYKLNFNLIQGTGVDAIQQLIDAYNTLAKSSAGQEGIMEFFAKVFGVRQGPRMEVAIAQAAEFDRTLKDVTISTDRAEKKIQELANRSITNINETTKANIPLIDSYKSIAVVARIATAQEGKAVEGFTTSVTKKQIEAAKRVRDEISKELKKETLRTGEDLIGQVATETGRAMMIQLAGSTNATEIAQRELNLQLQTLDVQIKRLRNSFKMLASDVLKQIAPAIKKFTDFATSLYEAFNNLDESTKSALSKIILGLAGATAAVGPLVFIFGQARLALGTLGNTLFGFLPGLKTLSVEAVAAREAMLYLKNPLVAVGDTIYNNNTRFATFIATLASGEGPVARLATQFGRLSGVLKETSTAQTPVATQVLQQITKERGAKTGADTIAGVSTITGRPRGAIRAIKSLGRGVFEDIADPSIAVSAAQAGAYLEEEASMIASGTLRGTPGASRKKRVRTPVITRAGATGIKRFIPKRTLVTKRLSRELLGEAIATRLEAFEAAGIRRKVSSSAIGGAALERGGREISERRALRIAKGGAAGRAVGIFDTIQSRAGKAASGVTGAPAAAMGMFRNATAAARKEVQALTVQNLAFGKGMPGIMARAKVSVVGFAKSFGLVTKAMNIMKVAWAATGIGLALLAVAGIVALVAQNFDEFKEKTKPAMDAFGAAFNAIKEGAMALIQPFMDLFASIGGGSDDAGSKVAGIATAVNIIAKVVQFLANVIKVAFQIIGKIIRYALGTWMSLFRGVADIVKGFKKILSGDLLGGIRQVFGGIIKAAYGMLGPFRIVFDFILNGWILIAKAGAKLLGWVPGLGGAVKKAVKGLEGLKGFLGKATEIKTTVSGKVKAKGPTDTSELDTGGVQEEFAQATGEGIDEGAAEGARAAAKRIASLRQSLIKEVQESVIDRVKGAMEDVVASLTETLRAQKEKALSVYDEQIDKINLTKKAEEELTRAKEYENKKREIEDKRALNALNAQRNYELAIYEGRIDDAREIAMQRQKDENDSNRELKDLTEARQKEIKDAEREALIDSIQAAKKAASQYFDDMIDNFTKAAKKITEFPPTTAAEFNTQLEQLKTAANNAANSMGTNFSQSFTGPLANLGVDTQTPLSTALQAIGKTIADNNPFGPEGVWQKSIDETIAALTAKYTGLNNTLGMIIDTKSGAFKKLFDAYKSYQDTIDEAAGGLTGGAGGGAGGKAPQGGSAFGGGGPEFSPGYYYRSKERGEKNWSSWIGPRKKEEIDAVKPILSKRGLFEFKFSNYNPGFVNVGKGSSTLTGVSDLGIVRRALGGVIPFMGGGPTKGPVQQSVPAILHGGEFVIRNSAVKKYGWGMLQDINQGTYQPKAFAKGGMVKELGRQIGQKWTKKDAAALSEWKNQMAKGYLNEEYWLAVGKAETGVDSSGRTPRWRRKNFTGGGGLAISEPTWRDYGGTDFAKYPHLATSTQQMVIANRIAMEGYTRKWPVGSSTFPAGHRKYNPPKLGWGVITNGSVPRPEDFVPKTYSSAFGQQFGKGGLVKELNKNIGIRNAKSKQPGDLPISQYLNKKKEIHPSKKKGGVWGFLNAVQSGVQKGMLAAGDAINMAVTEVIYKPIESLQASTLNPLLKALKVPGSEGLRTAGLFETGMNAAFLAAEVASAGMATGPISSIRSSLFSSVGKKEAAQRTFERGVLAKDVMANNLYTGMISASGRRPKPPQPRKVEPFISEMGARILKNVNESRLARDAMDFAYTGFGPEYMPPPKGGYRRPSLGGGWKGFLSMEKAANAAKAADAAAIRERVLKNIADSKAAREAMDSGLTDAFRTKAVITGREAEEQLKAPLMSIINPRAREGTLVPIRSIRNRMQYPDMGVAPSTTPGAVTYPALTKKYPSFRPFVSRGQVEVKGGGWKGFLETEKLNARGILTPEQRANELVRTRQRIIENIQQSKNARQARSSIYRDLFKNDLRYLNSEESRILNQLDWEDLRNRYWPEEPPRSLLPRSVRNQMGPNSVVRVNATGQYMLFSPRRAVPGFGRGVFSTSSTASIFSSGDGAYGWMKFINSPEFMEMIAKNKTIRIDRMAKEARLKQEAELAKQIMIGLRFIPNSGPSEKDTLINQLRTTYSELVNLPLEQLRIQELRSLLRPPKKLVELNVNEAISQYQDVMGWGMFSAKLWRPITEEIFEKAGLTNRRYLEGFIETVTMSGSIKKDYLGPQSGDFLDIGGMYSYHRGADVNFDIYDLLASVMSRIVDNPNFNIQYVGNTNSLSQYSSRLLKDVAEFGEFLPKPISVFGDTGVGNSIMLPDYESFIDRASLGGIPLGMPNVTAEEVLRNPESNLPSPQNFIYTVFERAQVLLKAKEIMQAKQAARMMKRRYFGGLIPSFANGGPIPGFASQGVPALLHGGEFVVNASAVKNIGLAALQGLNNMRFQQPKTPSYAGTTPQPTSSSSNIHIYVDNFIGEKAWFESMMKEYNVSVVPANQKAAGLQNKTISTYNGINRGM